jgi:hypothetical protein
MGKRLWLDDSRKPPFGYDLWAKTARQAIEYLEIHDIEHCSLDHDLAEEHYADSFESAAGYNEPPRPILREKYKELTGYAVLEWMQRESKWVPDISIHTLHGTAADDMLRLLRKEAPEHVEFRRVKPQRIT